MKRWTLLHLVHRVSQDLSIAGNQAGIHEGTRSSLFFEAIRIIQEMRNATANQFPRFAVWENVKNALSSNKGADFKAVLEAFCEAAGAEVSLPLPEVNKGKWATAGAIVGDGFSVAWRVYNAVGWGVPQRRERIYLVADFGGERAGEILFVEEGGRRNYETSFQAWKRFASDPEGGAGRSDHGGSVTVLYDARGNGDGKTCPTITGDHENRITDYTAVLVQKVTDE